MRGPVGEPGRAITNLEKGFIMKKFAVGVVLLAALGAACGKAVANDQPVEQSAAAQTTVQVTATEYAFDVPAEITGGEVEMRFTNNGSAPHEFVLFRIKDGKTEADVEAALQGQEPPKWSEDLGQVAALSPGESTTVTRTLEPGNYVWLCFLPGEDDMPHALMGMYELFSVTG